MNKGVIVFGIFALFFVVSTTPSKSPEVISKGTTGRRSRDAHGEEDTESFPGSRAEGPDGSKPAEALDIKSVQEIQSDMQLLAKAGANLQDLVNQINGILSAETSAKYSDVVHATGTNYYGVPTLVKIYKTVYGWQGYPSTLVGVPCATVPVVNTLPTLPILIKRITADTSYLVDLFGRGYVTPPAVSHSYAFNQATAVIGSHYEDHHH